MIKVFIDGQEGTTGLKINERFKGRDDITLLKIKEEYRKDASARSELINSSDVTFLCLPDAAAVEAVALVENADVKIIDASTAHRTQEGWAYGFPELGDDFLNKIKASKRIAVPGCHASGFCSIVYPLVSQEILPASYPFVCYSLTGYSGGGKKMIAEYEGEKSNELYAPRQYALTQEHKHLKEMQYVCSLSQKPIFAPIVDDYYSGMEVSVPVYASLAGGRSAKQIHEFFADFYANKKMVKVMPFADLSEFKSNMLAANAMSGTNTMRIFVGGNDERILIASIFDNLGKGASGAAVQCMNIACGLDEQIGLV